MANRNNPGNRLHGLMEQLANDNELEFFLKSDDTVRVYCAGGLFLEITKTGILHKHKYDEYFSEANKKEGENFIHANDQDALFKIYMAEDKDTYNAAKSAMYNRAKDCRPFQEAIKEDIKRSGLFPLERLYQQTIARNNRPDDNHYSGVADFSFGISSATLRGNNTKGATFVDLVWIDEAAKKIAFIEYKQGEKALNGKSGLIDHCTKTFLCMDNNTVKAMALERYYAKKAFHSGNLNCRATDFSKKAFLDAESYGSLCCIMLTNIPPARAQSVLTSLKGKSNEVKGLMASINAESKAYPDFSKVRYLLCDDYSNVQLSMAALKTID